MKKVLFLMLFLLVLGAAGTNAQVRIGGDGEPHTAAVLDLNTNDDATPAGNNGGLALPRVALINNTTQLNGTAPTKGTLVYNTNPDMANGQGFGVYYWNGSVWMVVAGEVGAPGPTAVGITASYKTWCFPAYTKLGCWTIDNSRETPAAGTTYSGQAASVWGNYYTHAQAAGACSAITGYVLPNEAQWTALRDYLNGPNSSAIERQHWLYGSAVAGRYYLSGSTWYDWGVMGNWWSSSVENQYFQSGDKSLLGPGTNTNFWFSVRCIKS